LKKSNSVAAQKAVAGGAYGNEEEQNYNCEEQSFAQRHSTKPRDISPNAARVYHIISACAIR
jgi:hypothetical protein